MLVAIAPGTAFAAPAPNPVVAENLLPGTTDWNIAPSVLREVEGYPTSISAAPGQTLQFHVQTTPPERYRIEIYRLGWYGGTGGRLLACLPSCTSDEAGVPQPVPPFDPTTGLVDAGWPVTDTIVVPDDWVSGYYLADIVETSKPALRVGYRMPFIVRAPANRDAQILVQVPVNTWEAYNAWGGRSLYYPDQTGVGDNHVSFERPFQLYSFTEGSQMQWELSLLHFLEREGYDVAYQTDIDTDADPGSLLQHRLVIVAGHSEYWTKVMRDAFERARDLGTNLAFMGADQSYWQIDYADASRQTLAEYRSPALDPQPDPSLKTTWFRRLTPARPECTLLGSEYPDIPGSWGLDSGIGEVADFTATAAASTDPWFAGTGFKPGDTLHDLVGGEWNTVIPGCQTQPLTVLFHYQGQPANADAVRYTATSGARVFTAGSLQFAAGLDNNQFLPEYAGYEDPRLERFMENAMADLSRPAAPTAVVVHNGAKVRIVIRRHPDPRVHTVAVYAHPGAGIFTLAARGVRRVCTTQTSACVVAGQPRGVVRYAAVAVDRWGESTPTFSAP